MLLNLVARPPRPPPDATRTTSRPSCGSSPTRATTTWPWRRPTSGSRTSAAARAGSLFGSGPGPELSERAGYLWWDEQPLVRVDEIALPGRAQPPERDGDGRRVPGPRDRRRGGRDRPAHVRRRPPPARADRRDRRRRPRSTTRRRPTSRARSSRCGRSPAAIHLIAGGRGKQQDFSPLAPLVAERCRAVYLIGEAAAELAAALEPSGVPLHQAGDLEHAVALARGGRRRRRGRAALAGLREL